MLIHSVLWEFLTKEVMNKKHLCTTVFLGLALLSCSKQENYGVIAENSAEEQESCFVKGAAEIFVTEQMALEIEENGVPAKFIEAGILKLERMFPDAGEWEERHRAKGLHRWYRAVVDDAVLQTKSNTFDEGLEGVEIFEPVRRVKRCASNLNSFPFNDPYGKKYQWHIINDGTQWPGYKAGADINVSKVYEEYTGGSPEVIVAVIDGGIYMEHKDLAAVTLPAQKGGSRNFVKNNYVIDADDHGSHVGGIIGAINNNSSYGCGVAGGLDGNGGVKLMSCEVFSGNSSGNFADAIVWAADNGALICNNSWGFEYNSETEAKNSKLNTAIKEAIDYFIENAGCDAQGNQVGLMKGGLVTFAAGNDGWRYAQPASYEAVLAVGAIGPDGRRSSYSNFGDWVDLCAPGGEADRFKGGAASDGSSYILSCNSKGDIVFMCGTSQACPMVSGVAALVLSAKGGPGFTVKNLWEALLNSANEEIVPASDEIGPLVDAYAAVSYGNATPVLSEGYKSYLSGREIGEDELAEVIIAKPGQSLTLDASKLFKDPDNDKLSYSLKSDNEALAEFNANGNSLVIKALKKGTAHCTLVATDPSKANVSFDFELGVFDDSEGPAIYPNPVTNGYFMISPGAKKDFSFDVINAAGATVFSASGSLSIFEPMRVDFAKYAPGSYVVRSRYDGSLFQTKIVKL